MDQQDILDIFPGSEDITNKCHEAALWYLKKGYSVIPVGIDKKPLIQWQKYQKIRATETEINQWWLDFPEANVGIVTGKLSNVTVIDVDDPSLLKDVSFPETFTVETGRGKHFYYIYTESRNTVNVGGKKIDLRSEGGYVIAPPSRHSSGKIYTIINRTAPTAFPIEWLNKVEQHSQISPGIWKQSLLSMNEEGSRNATFASIIGGLIKTLPLTDFETIGWQTVQSLNSTHNKPPLTEHELRSIFNSISEKEKRNRSTDSVIKDIISEHNDDVYKIDISLEGAIVHILIKNVLPEVLEGESTTWLEKLSGLTRELNFRIKITSDTNKEQWARLLSKAFDKKDNKEIYPWTIIVSEIIAHVAKMVRNIKQDYALNEIESEPLQWILEPFIQEKCINLLFGMGSSGKTLLAIYFASLIGTDRTIFENAYKKVNTLFIDYENTATSWKENLYGMLKTQLPLDELIKTFFYWDSNQQPLYEQVDKLKAFIRTKNIGLIIVDSASMASGDSTSDEKSAIKLMAGLKKLNSTCLVIAHQRKNDGEKTPIGSIQYENQARNVWNVRSEQDISDDRILHIACKHTKANNTFKHKNPIGFRVFFNDGTIDINTESAIEYFEETYTVNDQILNSLKSGGKTYKELATLLGKSEQHISRELSRLKSKGKVENIEGKWVIFEPHLQHAIYNPL
jgi:hypothetical protein